MKLFTRLIALLLTLLSAALLVGVYLLLSPQGLDWAYRFATVLLPGELIIEQHDGRLRGPIKLVGVHYHNNQIDVRISQLDLKWQPGYLIEGKLYIEDLAVTGLQIQHTSPAAAEEKQTLPDIKLPLALQIDHAELHDFQIAGGKGSHGFVMNDAKLRNAVFRRDRLDLQQLSVNLPQIRFTVSGKLTPQREYPLDLTVHWSMNSSDYGRLSGNGRFSGDLHKIDVRHQLTSPLHADLRGAITDPLDKVSWQGELSWPTVDLHTLNKSFPILSVAGKIHGSGDLKHVQAEGELHSIYKGLHTDHRFLIAYDHNKRLIKVQRLNSSISESGSTLAAHGTISNLAHSPIFELAGNWHKLRWPIKGEAMVKSEAGSFSLSGDLEHYQLTLAGNVTGKQLPNANVSINAAGQRQGLTISRGDVHMLGGNISVNGNVDWREAPQWQLNIQGTGLDPGKQWQNWPGHVDFATQVHGGEKNDVLQTHIALRRLHGEIKSIPVDADAEMSLEGNQLHLANLRIDSGENRLTASGTVRDEWNMEWRISAADLSHLMPKGGGKLLGGGSITGARLHPYFTATLSGQHVGFADNQIGALSLVMAVDTQARLPSTLEVELDDADFEKHHVDSLRLQGNGTAQHHQAQLTVAVPDAKLTMAVSGEYLKQTWKGTLQRLDLDLPPAGIWHLSEATPVTFDDAGLKLQNVCLQQDHARLCAIASAKSANEWYLNTSARDVPITFLEEWLPSGSSLSGNLDGRGNFSIAPNAPLDGEVDIKLHAGVVSPATLGTSKPTTHIAYHGGHVKVTLDPRSLSTNLSLDLADGNVRGTIHIDREALPAPLGASQGNREGALAGQLQGDIRDLSLLPAFIPGIEHTQGRLYSTLKIAGSWNQPRATGELRLEDGSAVIPSLGLNLDSIDIVARGDAQGRLHLDAQLHSKDGNLRLGGDIEYVRPQGWIIQAQLNGERAEIVNTTEYHILASPDMHLSVKGHRIDLDGELFIPEANLRPRDVSGAVSASDDVVIVNTEGATPAETRWQIYSNLHIRLGDFVKFSGFGLRGLLKGEFTLSDAPQKPTVARGELSIVNGDYRAYGQKLTIDRGRLLFFGGPVDNPGLDIRAVRKIQNVTAGIMVRGTLKSPQAQLFSEPAMAETDALSYLLIGQPINQATSTEGQQLYGAALSLGLAGSGLLANQIGQRFGIDEVMVESGGSFGTGALVIRHYLSPKLYISYGVGLVERFNVFLMRYQISRRWALEGESGIQSGADLLYTLERE